MKDLVWDSSEWLVRSLSRLPAELRLVCFPNAGAGMLMFRGWPDALPWAEVAFAHLPGRDGRRDDPIPSSIQAVADPLAHALLGLPPLPTVLFGHSMGALIAFETARRLQTAGRAPVGLIVSARRAPSTDERLPPLAHLPLEAFGRAARERYGGISDQVLDDPELAGWVLPVLRSDLSLVETYRYQPMTPLESPILVYAGEDDPHTLPDELDAWRNETRGVTIVRTFPGGHFYLDTARDVVLSTLMADARGWLAASRA